MAIVALEGMEFFAYHGLYEEEKKSGNDFTVDIYLDTGNRPLATSDDIADTPDYVLAYAIVKREMGGRQNLLESLVAAIGQSLLAEMKGIDAARVRVSKAAPPLEGPVLRSYVEETFLKKGA